MLGCKTDKHAEKQNFQNVHLPVKNAKLLLKDKGPHDETKGVCETKSGGEVQLGAKQNNTITKLLLSHQNLSVPVNRS